MFKVHTMQTYDQERHILLRDVAHTRCIIQDDEVTDFVHRVTKRTGQVPFEVEIPDWPRVLRTPLPIIVFGISLDGSDPTGFVKGGPTAKLQWEGIQLAILRETPEAWDQTYKQVRKVAREMVDDWMDDPHRVAYAWQVAEFDPAQHVVIRYWCRDNGVDIVDFWRKFYPQVKDDLPIIETSNPTVKQERARGSYSPTRRCIRRADLYRLRNHYLGTDETPQQAKAEPPLTPPQPRTVHDSDDEREEVVEWSIHDTVTEYKPGEVLSALTEALGQIPRLFSNTMLDSRIVAISREAMVRYLAANPVDKRQYIKDDGGRNFDCDDFALTLRSDLIRDHGYNCCGVIAGDVHAWNVFVLAGDNGPEIAFIEPQTDGLVIPLEGNYSVDCRCEVII